MNSVQEQSIARTELTATEQQLMAEMMQLARKLDKKNVLGVYRIVADTVQAVSERKMQGLEAIAVLARGMDMLKEHAATKRARRLAILQELMTTFSELFVWIMFLIAVAMICMIAGVAGYSQGYYIGAAFFCLAILGMLPAAVKLWYSR